MVTGRRSRPAPSGPSMALAIAAVLAPLLLLAVVRLRPDFDVAWENHPAHFWIVLAAAVIATALGYAVSVAARRRQDARLFLISLAFISGAGFLGLHALATPGVLLGPNAGFEFATPVGLALGSAFVAASVVDLSERASRRVMTRSRGALVALGVLMLAWAVVSIAELPPLHEPVQGEVLQGWQVVFALVGIAGYGVGALGYLRLYRRRGARFVFAVSLAFALLGVTMVIVAFAVNWRVSWWEWHVVMLAAFVLVAVAAREEWHEERFSPLYLERTLAGAREVSILFADLAGYTAYSEATTPADTRRMLNAYLARLVPLMEELGGEVHELAGDAVMVVFNKDGDRPDHAARAGRAALAFQVAAAEVASDNPEWPRFRVGVNSGGVVAGVVGDRGRRKHDVIGDAVNLAARLEAQAPVGEVVIGQGTYEGLPAGALVERLPPLHVKGKREPVTAYLLRDLPG